MTALPTALPWETGRRSGLRSLFAAFLPRGDRRAARGGFTSSHGALREQDPQAWREVFEQEHAAIYRYAASRLGSGAEAEDATSQVFAEAWANAANFDDHGLPVRAWLFGIARNVVNSHRRRVVLRPPAVSLEAFDAGDDDPALDAERLDLAKAVASLERSWADVITLRFIHGLSLHETAAALGMSTAAVKGKQARALTYLRERLTAGR